MDFAKSGRDVNREFSIEIFNKFFSCPTVNPIVDKKVWAYCEALSDFSYKHFTG